MRIKPFIFNFYLLLIPFSTVLFACESDRSLDRKIGNSVEENNKSEFNRKIKIGPNKTYYKEMRNKKLDSFAISVNAHETNNEIFDFSVLTRESYDKYKMSKNSSDLIYIVKMWDRTKIDTTVYIPKGEALFGFSNHINADSIDFNIKLQWIKPQ